MAFEEAQGFGGAFVDLKHIALELVARGVEVTIAHSYDGPWWDDLRSRGVRCLLHGRWDLAERASLDPKLGARLPRWARVGLYGLDVAANQVPLALRYAAWMRRNGVDTVFLNNALTQNLSGALAARALRLPLHVYYQGPARLDKLVRRMLPWVTRTFTVSRWTAEENVRRGLPMEGALTLYPGIEPPGDPALCEPLPAVEGAPIRVGMVGMITPWKGQLAFLEAFALATAQSPVPIEAWLFGAAVPGHEPYERTVRARIDALGLADKVRIISDRSHPDQIYPEVDFTVHSSIDPEPFGRVIIEAMAYARPVIAAGDGGTQENVEEGETGYLASPHEPALVAERIVQLASDRAARRAMGRRAREHVSERFTYPAVLRPLLSELGVPE